MILKKIHGNRSCKATWDKFAEDQNKARTVKCKEPQCFKHWSMCPEHKVQNKKKYDDLTSRYAWQFIQMAPGVHENAINHFWDLQSPITPPHTPTIPHLNMPVSPNITVESAHYFDSKQKRDPDDQSPESPPRTKTLFIYYMKTPTGEEVKVMADGGATISLLKHSEKDKLGIERQIGETTLTGVGNQQVSTRAPIVHFSLASSFNKKMKQFPIDSAVIQTITTIPNTNLVHAIKTVLKVMYKKCKLFMKENEHYIKFDNFQTGYEGGDIDFLLGIPELSIHPKIIVQFSNGTAIALIRQPTKHNKFLILVGPIRDAESLMEADVEIGNDTKDLAAQHANEVHLLHCEENKHITSQEHEAQEAETQQEEPTEHDNINEERASQVNEEQEIEKDVNFKKTILKPGITNTKPKRGDVIKVNYTSKLGDGSTMDNTLRQEPYVFVSEITPTTKGFQHAVSTMNCQEKASFEIPSKWMYGKAGIPSNIPPNTDFILEIHRMETEQLDEETQIQVEIGLQINHTEEQREMGIPKLSDKEFANIAIGIVTAQREELGPQPDQQTQRQQAPQFTSQSFLGQGQHTKQKT